MLPPLYSTIFSALVDLPVRQVFPIQSRAKPQHVGIITLKYHFKNSEGSKVGFLDTLSVVVFIVLFTQHVIKFVYYDWTRLALCWTELSTQGKQGLYDC
jgi:hypothetical protein